MVDDDLDRDDENPSGLFLVLTALALLIALVSLASCYFLQNRLSLAEAQLADVEQNTVRLTAERAESDRELRATREALGARLGITQRQIEQRAEDILRRQEISAQLLAQQEAETHRQVGSVSTQVTNVQNDVGGVKRDVAETKKELANTQQQLQQAVGDLGVQSGLIATNASELEYLKHLGDRNYFQFTLHKGQQPLEISSIKLQLRKTDGKRSRYTLEVFSDDRRIEKKNREVDEPLQFYSGKHPALYEIVINEINRNDVSGYLSTPKNIPQAKSP